MDKTINTLFNTDEDTKIGNIFNFSFNNRTNRIVIGNQIPWVRLKLFHTKRDPLGLSLDVEHHDFDLITDGNHLGWMTGFFRPGHFGYMNQALNTFFQFDKNTVIGNGNDLSFSGLVHRIPVR